MAWIRPKTDWTIQPRVNGVYNGDWFNTSDYDRIRGNIEFLVNFAAGVGLILNDIADMPDQTMTDYPRASLMNNIEANILSLATASGIPYLGASEWADNGPTPTVDDLNRWESACVLVNQALMAIQSRMTRIPFNVPYNLGGSEF